MADDLQVKKISIEGPHGVVLDVCSSGSAPLEAKYVEHLICGLFRQSECLSECSQDITIIIAKFAFKIGAAFTKTKKEMADDLMKACKERDIWMIRQILTIDPRNINIYDDSGMTALHVAAKSGHRDICALLIDHGVLIDAVSKSGTTALSLAFTNGHVDVVKLLLRHDADVNLSCFRIQQIFT